MKLLFCLRPLVFGEVDSEAASASHFVAKPLSESDQAALFLEFLRGNGFLRRRDPAHHKGDSGLAAPTM